MPIQYLNSKLIPVKRQGAKHVPNTLSVTDFSSGLFWHVNPATIDCEKHINYIVGRALEADTLADWNLLCQHLSLRGVMKIAQNLRSIDKKVSLSFLSWVKFLRSNSDAAHRNSRHQHIGFPESHSGQSRRTKRLPPREYYTKTERKRSAETILIPLE